jgi:flagellar basal-body rod modification protein FlgD
MPTNLVTTPIAGTGNTPTATQSGPVISSDFETFLKMLTAQAQYQDPLDPIDSSQYASQLAQFSAVEQQVLSNDLLTALVGQMGTTNMAQLAGWVGIDARSTAPVSFDGSPVTLQAQPNAYCRSGIYGRAQRSRK